MFLLGVCVVRSFANANASPNSDFEPGRNRTELICDNILTSLRASSVTTAAATVWWRVLFCAHFGIRQTAAARFARRHAGRFYGVTPAFGNTLPILWVGGWGGGGGEAVETNPMLCRAWTCGIMPRLNHYPCTGRGRARRGFASRVMQMGTLRRNIGASASIMITNGNARMVCEWGEGKDIKPHTHTHIRAQGEVS